MIFCIPAHDVYDRSLKLVQTSFHDALKSPRVGIRAFYHVNSSRAQNGLRAFAGTHIHITRGSFKETGHDFSFRSYRSI